jgi:hypothetical protein
MSKQLYQPNISRRKARRINKTALVVLCRSALVLPIPSSAMAQCVDRFDPENLRETLTEIHSFWKKTLEVSMFGSLSLTDRSWKSTFLLQQNKVIPAMSHCSQTRQLSPKKSGHDVVMMWS